MRKYTSRFVGYMFVPCHEDRFVASQVHVFKNHEGKYDWRNNYNDGKKNFPSYVECLDSAKKAMVESFLLFYPKWQPMRTAPMDESLFFLCYKLNNKISVRTARYYAHAKYWKTSHCEIVWDIRDGEISVSPEFEGELLGWMQPKLPTEEVK